MMTLTDLFCGAGGSSTGAEMVPGIEVVMAANHWPLAIETHQANHPNTAHDCADLSQVDPRRYPTTEEPARTITTASADTLNGGTVNIDDVRFRMLNTHEITRAMAFPTNYIIRGNRGEKVKQAGNAATSSKPWHKR